VDVISPEAYAEGERDALAILAAIVAGDWEAVEFFQGAAAWPVVFAVVLNLLFDELAGQGTDPAGWVEQKQAGLRARLADGG
jgi:hypothetical protein